MEHCYVCTEDSYVKFPQVCPKREARDCMSMAEDIDEVVSKMEEIADEAEKGAQDLKPLIEIRPQTLNPATEKNGEEWEYVEAIVDSGASVTVFPPKIGAVYEITEGEAAKAGVMYEVANGEEIPNLGERHLPVMTTEGTIRGIKAPIAKVSKPLQAVRSLAKSGHMVIFGDGPEGTVHYVVIKFSGEHNAIKDDGINYLMGMHIVPPSVAGFTRPAERR